MLKRLTLLIAINISFNVFANSWQENYFKFNTVYSLSSLEQSTLYTDPSYVNKLTIQTTKQVLGNGYGLNFLGALSPYYIEQTQLADNDGVNFDFNLNGILFFSPSNEVSFGYMKKNEFSLFNNRLEKILSDTPQEFISDQDRASFNLTAGKDKAFFFLNYQFSYLNVENEDLITDIRFESITNKSSIVNMLWRQSEDTQWGTRVEFIENKRKLLGVEHDSDIENYYLSSVISYFSTSQLTTNLGISRTDNEQQASWDLQHKTFVSDNTNFTFRAYRKFEQAIDNEESEELNTRYKADLRYNPLDFLSLKVNYLKEKRSRDEKLTYRKRAISVNAELTYQESWVVSTAYSSEKIDDYANLKQVSQNKIELTVSRAFI